jgi:hypothetical protein
MGATNQLDRKRRRNMAHLNAPSSRFSTFASLCALSALGAAASTASADPSVFPMPDVNRQATQGFYLVGCGGEACLGAFFAEDFFDPKGEYQYSSLTVLEYGDKPRAALCPLKRGELSVRNDAGFASLNATINVADCGYVTETCDAEGTCTPDYAGVITIAATAKRPEVTSSGITRRTNKGPGFVTTFTCNENLGQDFAEAAAAVNGKSWIVDSSQATKRDCGGMANSK